MTPYIFAVCAAVVIGNAAAAGRQAEPLDPSGKADTSITANSSSESDWPTWRYDSARGAATIHELDRELYLHWTRQLPEPRRAWPWQMDDFEKLAFDQSYEPVAAGGYLYVPSMVTDSVTAYSIDSGREQWSYQTGGPVRLAPLVWEDRVYVGADDGFMHCLDAGTGEKLWEFRAAPGDRKVLGNERLISMWPVRGGPVVDDGMLYFAAGLWPHEGIFVYALDARTAEVKWVNSGAAGDLVLDSKQYYSFGGVVPQGHLAVKNDRLFVPGGRTVPAVFDRHSGELKHFRVATDTTGKGAGGHCVFIQGDWYFNVRDSDVTHMYSAQDGAQFGAVDVDIVSGDNVFGVDDERRIVAHCREPAVTNQPPEPVAAEHAAPDAARRGPRFRGGRLRRGALSNYYDLEVRARSDRVDGLRRLHLMAGSILYGSGEGGRIFAINFSAAEESFHVVWTKRVRGEVFSMLAAGDRLFVITKEGRIYCFGPGKREKVAYGLEPESPADETSEWAARAEEILESVELRGGYGLMFGIGSGKLLDALLELSDLHMVAFDPDAGKVARFRERYLQAGMYGSRVAIHEGNALSARLPPYIADLVVSEDARAAGAGSGAGFAEALFRPLRPYGGTAWLALPAGPAQDNFAESVVAAGLENNRLELAGAHARLTRPGALPGSSSWTHQYSDAGNTAYSPDTRVRAPLGITWFGGEPNHKTLPRHMFGPSPQVADGRLLLMGPHHVSARCVYTGRELWVTELPMVGANFTSLEHERQAAPVYFPSAPGANFIGSPMASAADSVYVIYEHQCLRLDTATGEVLKVFRMPDRELLEKLAGKTGEGKTGPSYGARLQEGNSLPWGHIRYIDGILIAAAYPHLFDERQPGDPGNWNAVSSEFIVAMDRYTGEPLWAARARYGFRHNAIVAGNNKVFAIDNLSEEILQRLARRGIEPDAEPKIYARELHTGDEVWSRDSFVFGTALAYSAEHDALLQCGHPGRRGALPDEPRDRVLMLRGETGEKLWQQSRHQRRAPLGLHAHRKLVIGSSGEGALDMLTGEPYRHEHPLTGLEETWDWMGALRCGSQNYSRHLITFRSGAGGFADLDGKAMSGNIPGFRPGCTMNLVVADGMLNAPDYTRSCSCSYQHQTSLGITHMPEAEMWMFSPLSTPERGAIRRIGVNLGAPGGRFDNDSDLLWLECPPAVGPAPDIAVELVAAGGKRRLRHHTSVIKAENDSRRWIAASGIEGEIELRINGLAAAERTGGGAEYKVRLHFAELDHEVRPGERLFNIYINGELIEKDFDIAAEGDGEFMGVVSEHFLIAEEGRMDIALRPTGNSEKLPLICGVELDFGDGRRRSEERDGVVSCDL